MTIEDEQAELGRRELSEEAKTTVEEIRIYDGSHTPGFFQRAVLGILMLLVAAVVVTILVGYTTMTESRERAESRGDEHQEIMMRVEELLDRLDTVQPDG
jgi:hypothetical protein